VSGGTFDIEGGMPMPATLAVPAQALSATTKFVVTIEASGDADPAPAAAHVLAGTVSGGSAALTVADADALGTDFGSAAGTYINAIPTLGSGSYNQGIWFLTGSPAAASLTLPTLPAGWAYEGWIVQTDGTKHSTGVFTDPAMGDDNNPTGAPPFPGRDFAFSLIGTTVAISVEPVPDTGADPYGPLVLMDATVQDVGEGVDQALGDAVPAMPSGMITVGGPG
jgi:hypothetical protein